MATTLSTGAASASLPPLTQFGATTNGLLHPSNPVIFFDVATESAFGKAKPDPSEKGRIYIELFSHWSPKMAENMRRFCTGEARKLNLGASSGPVGYKGSFLFAAVPGREVVGGDVLRGDGTGAPFSAFGGDEDFFGTAAGNSSSSSSSAPPNPNRGGGGGLNAPFVADSIVSNAVKQQLLNKTPGLVRMVPSVLSTASAAAVGAAGGGTVSVNHNPNQTAVGSMFSICCLPPCEIPQSWAEDHWTTVVGRVVGRTNIDSGSSGGSNNVGGDENTFSSASNNSNNDDVMHVLALLQRCGKDIYTARRRSNNNNNTTTNSSGAGLPIIGQCGEM